MEKEANEVYNQLKNKGLSDADKLYIIEVVRFGIYASAIEHCIFHSKVV